MEVIDVRHPAWCITLRTKKTIPKSSELELTLHVYDRPRLHQDWIDSHAYGIVKALQKSGFTTYLVGGCVRDLLLGMHPKDYDIATSAHPPQVKKLIYMSFVIGKRFRLVLVKREQSQYEVATFRREFDPTEFPEGEAPLGDNVFGTPEQDAMRRDFTINALFYDPIANQVIDYVEGERDIEARVVRMIGDPLVRLVEDPIRILRALRLCYLVGFQLDDSLRAAMSEKAETLARAALPRKREEILKLLRLKDPSAALMEAHDLGILRYTLPSLDLLLKDSIAQEDFLFHFARLQPLVVDPSKPTELFAWMIYAMLECFKKWQRRAEPEALPPDWYMSPKSDRLDEMMRNELGMFKYEQAHVMKALELQSQLPRAEDFRRRGPRRQFALLRNEGFELALRLATLNIQLNGEQTQFWTSIMLKYANEVEVERESRRKTRPRRRRRRDAGVDDAEEAEEAEIDEDSIGNRIEESEPDKNGNRI